MKKIGEILKRIFVYCVLVSLLTLAEKRFGIFGLGLAFCFALIYCGESITKSLIPYLIIVPLIHFSL
ncbi:MAG: hypothetical protein J6A99_00200, partial [Clostridia bacterium]|nr:hypothetical protein [Clostridia bacterium]